MQILFSIFLILHGLIHITYLSPEPPKTPTSPEWPFDLTKSSILNATGITSETLKIVAIVLIAISTVGFVLSALGWLGVPFLQQYWVIITTISCIASFLLLAIFWHNWLIMGPIIDIVILYAIYFRDISPK